MKSKICRLLRYDTPSILFIITTFYTLFRSWQVEQYDVRLWLTICTTIVLFLYFFTLRRKGLTGNQSSDQLDVKSCQDLAFIIVVMLFVLGSLAWLLSSHTSEWSPLFGSLISALVLSALFCWKAP